MSVKNDQCDRQRIKDFVGSRMPNDRPLWSPANCGKRILECHQTRNVSPNFASI